LIFLYVLKLIMKSTNSMALRIVAAVVAAYIMGGGVDLTNLTLLSPTVLLESVTSFCTALTAMATGISLATDIELKRLAGETSAYETAYESAYQEIQDTLDELNDGISTEFVAGLSTIEPISQYLYGVDAMMYQAVGIQYEYDRLYDYNVLVSDYYDRSLRLGIV